MTPPDSPFTPSTNGPLGALLGNAQALVAAATAQALREAGSSPREFRLLQRLARISEVAGTDHARHLRRRIDVKVAQPGSMAATFAARGWLAYTDQAWHLTTAGETELARLENVVAEIIPATNTDLGEALTALIDSLGGEEAAREAHRTQRRRMGKRFTAKMHRFGHAHHHRCDHESRHHGCAKTQPGEHPNHGAVSGRGFNRQHGRGRGVHRPADSDASN
ncbi:hypothetical protein ACQUSY_04300 [Microbacterium sp. YY-03]|uniref:hypothetical protein n=1 Tax=Microbacterium sp. YY-03 TaxID=3421636 RepID=UPI003D178D6C